MAQTLISLKAPIPIPLNAPLALWRPRPGLWPFGARGEDVVEVVLELVGEGQRHPHKHLTASRRLAVFTHVVFSGLGTGKHDMMMIDSLNGWRADAFPFRPQDGLTWSPARKRHDRLEFYAGGAVK